MFAMIGEQADPCPLPFYPSKCKNKKNYLTCRSRYGIVVLQKYYDRRNTIDIILCHALTDRRYSGGCIKNNTEKGGCAVISSDGIRGYNDMMILYLILNEPSYGYEISKEIKNRTNSSYIIKETTLYSAFTRLEKNGYLESFYGNETFGKRRTYYRITDAGIAYYQEKCREWQLTKEVVDKFIF